MNQIEILVQQSNSDSSIAKQNTIIEEKFYVMLKNRRSLIGHRGQTIKTEDPMNPKKD